MAKRAIKKSAGPAALVGQEFWALNDVSFDIRRGEAVGIVGHNGAGKSTMLKHLSGLLKPTSGTLAINGRLAALIEVGAGFHQDLTGRENVFLNGVILGMTRKEIHRKFDEIVEFSGLGEFIDTPVKRYSSGMYARLGFSVAAHMEPEILVIDEVLSVGDAAFQARGVEKMRQVLRSGTTVIFVSHNIRAIADLCPRALLLKKGALLLDGPTSDVIRAYMEQVKGARRVEGERDVMIADVAVSDANGVRFDYKAGQRTSVKVTLKAARHCEKLSCYILLQDDRYYDVFATSSERLGIIPFSMEAGEQRTCSFELDLHLAPGSYQLSVGVNRNDIDRNFDQVDSVATLLISSAISMRGSANLYPTASLA
jgi:lipopolysaccharide transport system ATP-binding protein